LKKAVVSNSMVRKIHFCYIFFRFETSGPRVNFHVRTVSIISGTLLSVAISLFSQIKMSASYRQMFILKTIYVCILCTQMTCNERRSTYSFSVRVLPVTTADIQSCM